MVEIFCRRIKFDAEKIENAECLFTGSHFRRELRARGNAIHNELFMARDGIWQSGSGSMRPADTDV